MLDPDCSRTTKNDMDPLDKVQLLDTGKHEHFVHYYSSPKLFEEMFYRQILTCSTVRSNKKDLP